MFGLIGSVNTVSKVLGVGMNVRALRTAIRIFANSVLVRLEKPIQLKHGTFTIYQNSESPMFQFNWLP